MQFDYIVLFNALESLFHWLTSIRWSTPMLKKDDFKLDLHHLNVIEFQLNSAPMFIKFLLK